jgi:glucose-6-phosphate dehydrogenase assembly protein OpcA
VSEDTWSAEDTTPDAIEAAFRELVRERHAADRALAPARVLNLIVIVDRDCKDNVSERLKHVGRYQASRTILCSVEPGRTTLDAVATMAYEDGGGPGVHPMRERVDIDLGPEQLCRLDTIVDPVTVSELPTMLWSPHGHDQAVKALLPLTDVILLDSDSEADVGSALQHAAELREDVYVVDLAWLRTTPWRERLAASFDPSHRRPALNELTEVCVRHMPTSGASAALLAGWLAARLHWEPAPLHDANGAGRRGTLRDPEGERDVTVTLAPQDQDVPGLVGVTVEWGQDCSLSLDRGGGGLRARQCDPGAEDRTWRVLGASRGEGLILGEGVRQALLRDATYAPALESARVLTGTAES